MSNPIPAAAQIGTTGNARSYGIPALAVQWTGADGTTTRLLKVFTSHEKSVDAVIQTGTDNANEVANINPTQRKMPVKFSSIPSDTSQANAAAIANDLPAKGALINVGHITAGAFVAGSSNGAVSATAIDPQIETSYAVCDSAQARRSPEGNVTIDIDVTIHYNADGSFKQLAALT